MKKLFLLPVILILLFSCSSDNGDTDKAKNVSLKWINENILPLYTEKDKAVILSSKEEIEAQTNFKYIAQKLKWKGALEENGYNFTENSERALLAHKIYDDYTKYSLLTDITEDKIAYKNYLYEWTQRAADLLESSDCETKIDNTNYFYVIRYFIKHIDSNPENNTEKYIYDMIDVILDENFNVINKMQK
nr:MAG TPA: Protein involved in gliding motility 9 Secretion System Type.5A [Caudoviricetes sp.]